MKALPPKKIAVDFFQCVTLTPKSETPTTVEGMLKKVFALPTENRSEDVSGYPVRLNRFEEIEGCWIGELAKYRIYDPAIKGKKDGDTEAVVILEGESLVALTVFLYDPVSKILCLERNRLAVGATSFCKYLGYKAHSSTSLELRPIIQEDALQAITEMKAIRKIGFRVASWGNLGNAVKKKPAVGRAIQIAEELSAPTVYIEAGMSHEKGSLDRKSIMSTLHDLIGIGTGHPESVTSVKVFGTEEGDDEIHAVDLLENRLYFDEEVSLSHNPDELYDVRQKLVRRAWNARRAEAKKILNRDA